MGNLAFTSTKEKLQKVFKGEGKEEDQELLSVRLLSTKEGKSRGCAFVDFETSTGLQRGLQLHHTKLDGRVINVELTAGGGGNGEKRGEKLKKKNGRLDEERVSLDDTTTERSEAVRAGVEA